MNKIIPHAAGLILIVSGWLLSIVNVGLDKFGPSAIFTKWTGIGLLIILIGAYLPEIWIGIRDRFGKE